MPSEADLERSDWTQYAIDKASWDLAGQRDDALRDAACSYLPRPLKWSVDHPRVLRVLYRLHPSWRPRVTVGVDLGVTVVGTLSKDGRVVFTETFGIERDRSQALERALDAFQPQADRDAIRKQINGDA